MTLSNKQKALLSTFGFITISVIVGLLMEFVAENVSPDTIFKCIGAGFLGWMLYIVYALFLARFEHEEKIQNLVDKK